jgi:hypothetical protein
VNQLGLERGSRSARFEIPTPTALHREAVRRPESIQAERDGIVVLAATVVELPVELLWKAVNDEDHHDLDGRYIPVEQSTVIGGQPRGQSRLLFQAFRRWGIGRWWVSRIEMNEELYRESEAGLWELFWTDEIDAADRSSSPVAEAAEAMPPLRSSQGAWLLAPLANDCTLVEYFTRSEPGGVVKLGQLMFAKRGVRLTIEGMIRLAREHIPAHTSLDFVRPDGVPLGSPTEEGGGALDSTEPTLPPG